jgi:hypothetical protein
VESGLRLSGSPFARGNDIGGRARPARVYAHDTCTWRGVEGGPEVMPLSAPGGALLCVLQPPLGLFFPFPTRNSRHSRHSLQSRSRNNSLIFGRKVAIAPSAPAPPPVGLSSIASKRRRKHTSKEPIKRLQSMTGCCRCACKRTSKITHTQRAPPGRSQSRAPKRPLDCRHGTGPDRARAAKRCRDHDILFLSLSTMLVPVLTTS